MGFLIFLNRQDIYQKVKNIGGIAAYTGKVEK